MKKVLCKKDFWYEDFHLFKRGLEYFYWNNFGGLNHFVSHYPYGEDNKNIMVFGGEPRKQGTEGRPYIYDFFYTEAEHRDIKINKIVEC